MATPTRTDDDQSDRRAGEIDLVGLDPPTWSDQMAEIVSLVGGRRLITALGVAVVAALVVGAALWWPRTPPVEDLLPMATPGVPSPTTGLSTSTAPTFVVAYATGAVTRPGVYQFEVGARVDDLLTAAGGPASGADLDRLNLAALLVDGERVYVPRVGEPDPPPVVGAVPAAPADGHGGASSSPATAGPAPGPVDINTATATELDSLPGVGPATAAAIISYREQHGAFTAVDQLLDVRGIGDAKLEQLRDLVVVG